MKILLLRLCLGGFLPAFSLSNAYHQYALEPLCVDDEQPSIQSLDQPLRVHLGLTRALNRHFKAALLRRSLVVALRPAYR